jgi:hypothetical protein
VTGDAMPATNTHVIVLTDNPPCRPDTCLQIVDTKFVSCPCCPLYDTFKQKRSNTQAKPQQQQQKLMNEYKTLKFEKKKFKSFTEKH